MEKKKNGIEKNSNFADGYNNFQEVITERNEKY